MKGELEAEMPRFLSYDLILNEYIMYCLYNQIHKQSRKLARAKVKSNVRAVWSEPKSNPNGNGGSQHFKELMPSEAVERRLNCRNRCPLARGNRSILLQRCKTRLISRSLLQTKTNNCKT
eukprot:Protomagalhaensia_sp_Gyna_25__1536@NODE_1790_length_1537_cov_158_081442_g1468_i0_p3_GENE_NODE_1790_length_1537_cov_158_081442_g1468_i0NODE_1790_length_1537_cov_158_081442_g1468_i0_p3_ORF_typecomplete_len120_score5_51_NODE_1790_length_1537_cov_158_081442_g1468_i0483842